MTTLLAELKKYIQEREIANRLGSRDLESESGWTELVDDARAEGALNELQALKIFLKKHRGNG